MYTPAVVTTTINNHSVETNKGNVFRGSILTFLHREACNPLQRASLDDRSEVSIRHGFLQGNEIPITDKRAATSSFYVFYYLFFIHNFYSYSFFIHTFYSYSFFIHIFIHFLFMKTQLYSYRENQRKIIPLMFLRRLWNHSLLNNWDVQNSFPVASPGAETVERDIMNVLNSIRFR